MDKKIVLFALLSVFIAQLHGWAIGFRNNGYPEDLSFYWQGGTCTDTTNMVPNTFVHNQGYMLTAEAINVAYADASALKGACLDVWIKHQDKNNPDQEDLLTGLRFIDKGPYTWDLYQDNQFKMTIPYKTPTIRLSGQKDSRPTIAVAPI